MRKYELTLSPDYVPGWSAIDAVRELFQNALDQEVMQEDNKMFFGYRLRNDNVHILYVGNKSSVLEAKTLLMGSSTKRTNKDTIGKFGEGYKVATLVLLRLGFKVTFYNYGAKEVWQPRFVKSRRYGGENILTFFINDKWPWEKVPDNNLTIEIEGITPELYKEIVETNLHLQDVGETIETSYGRILLEERYKGKVFVNGLWVCNYDQYLLGYDFKPAHINIDRDRKLVSDFDLKWLSSKMWGATSDPRIVELAAKNAADVQYVTLHLHQLPYDKLNELYDKAFDDFVKENGTKAIPVTDQAELENVPSGYKAVIVPESRQSLVKASKKYVEPEKPVKQTFSRRLQDWFDNLSVRYEMKGDEVAMFEHILDELEGVEAKWQ
jgi:hypothetical protein